MKKLWIALIGVAMAGTALAAPAAAAVGPPNCFFFGSPLPPRFTVVTLNTVGWGGFGECFHTGAPITVTFDDPTTAQNPDQTRNVGLSNQTGGFNMADAGLLFSGVPNGGTVTVSDGNGLTTTLVVPNLTVTAVDAADNTVSGTAMPGSRVSVGAMFHWPRDGANATESATRSLIADGSGNWTADFTVLTEPDDTGFHDVRSGTGVVAAQINPDPPAGWPGPGPFPLGLWQFTTKLWVIRQLQPQTTQECRQGNWAYVIDDVGNHFKNQGDCVSFVATGGRNKGDGGPFG
jgi:hypothetical protein